MMEHKGYLGKVEFDADANLLHGEVLGIRDVVTFQGTSVDEIEEAFRDSVDDYLDFCKERGEKPDKPCSGRFVVRMTPDLHRRASMVAATSRMSLNAFVAKCVERWVVGQAPPPKPDTRKKGRQRRTRPSKAATATK